ncbi:hypothetical protein HHI36_015191 [Cryptolaemus montrouzieri]|uniref:Receptor ligand binding region domain-containing protein n=1 Tax=Cryptolaemus montrouzieri TaxID=559131 RepID=A0ABD2N5B2_9CUCU
METTFFLIIVSGIRFATNGPSKQENSTSGYLKSPSIRDGVHFNKEASQFSELERACLNNSDRELYNYLTKKGDKFNDSESITIGFLGAYGSTQVVLGALPLAVEAVNEDATLLPGIRLNFVAGDIGTNSPSSGLARSKSSLAAQAIKFMTKMRDSGAVAFIGPDEMCFSEALVAAAWNLPMISYWQCSRTIIGQQMIIGNDSDYSDDIRELKNKTKRERSRKAQRCDRKRYKKGKFGKTEKSLYEKDQ